MSSVAPTPICGRFPEAPGASEDAPWPRKKTSRLKRKLTRRSSRNCISSWSRCSTWIKETGQKLVLIFEGRDAAGKGGAVKTISEPLNPRGSRIVALGTPSDREKTQWYFQRYIAHLPAAGEIVLFDRSWYNRAGVEHVMGFCSDEEYKEFLRACPEFERMLVRSGITLLKYWFSVSDEEQERRFKERAGNPARRWKLSPMDLESMPKWVEYLQGQGRDVPSYGHQEGSLVDRGGR